MSTQQATQATLQLAATDAGTTNVEKYEFEPIKGYPMLNWRGKRPFTSTQYFPAQLKEVHGEEVDGWRNKIFWGDNVQVMSHLLKQFRGKIDLVYIDPPFDSKAQYKKEITIGRGSIYNDSGVFEEKQYSDIWSNDEYLQFMYELSFPEFSGHPVRCNDATGGVRWEGEYSAPSSSGKRCPWFAIAA